MTTATADLTPFQRLLFSHLPAKNPAHHLRQFTVIKKGAANKIMRHHYMPCEANARSISEGLHIPWETIVEACRASCVGRPLPVWALAPGETPGRWAGYRRPPNRRKVQLASRPISQSRWFDIVCGIRPGPKCVVDPAQVLLDWMAFGATLEQVIRAAKTLGVSLMTAEVKRRARTACMGFGRGKWVDILTGRLADGPPQPDQPQLRYVSAGRWQARAWGSQGPCTFEDTTPGNVMECLP